MGKQVVWEYYCDRPGCGKQYKIRDNDGERFTRTLSDLDWDVCLNGSSSKDTVKNPPKMTCPECTTEFLNFWNAKKEDR